MIWQLPYVTSKQNLFCKLMTFNRFVSFGLVSFFCLSLAPAARAQAVSELRESRESTEISESNATSSELSTPSQTTEWSEMAYLKDGFLQGCVGEEQLSGEQSTIKHNYCQCAFDAYSERYSPYQFLQINTLATQIGEDGISLVNLMMDLELKGCSESTGFARG